MTATTATQPQASNGLAPADRPVSAELQVMGEIERAHADKDAAVRRALATKGLGVKARQRVRAWTEDRFGTTQDDEVGE